MEKVPLKPFWAAAEIFSKGFFDALTNAALIGVLIVAYEKYGLRGLGPFILVGCILLVISIGIKAWQIAETLHTTPSEGGGWITSTVFSMVMTVMSLLAAGGVLIAAHELVTKH